MGEPTWYASSEIAERGFCSACGAQLFVRYSVPEWTGWISCSLGSHDDPNAVPVERYFGTETRQAWLQIHDSVPVSEYPDDWLEDVTSGKNDTYNALPRNLK